MPLTIISADTTTTTTNTIISADGDDLYLQEDVLLASTGATGVYVSESADNNNIHIDGNVVAGLWAILTSANSDDTRIVIGETGSLTSFYSNSTTAGVQLGGERAHLINLGQISSPETVAVKLDGSDSEVQNTGTISGITGVAIFEGSTNTVVANYGDIFASGNLGSIAAWAGSGIYATAANVSILNGDGGRIISTAQGGTGILAGVTGADPSIENHGEISALLGVGVDFSFVSASSGRLLNSGMISGTTALEGGSQADHITNSGIFYGDVNLNNGADSYRGQINGTVLDGAVFGGAGNDTIIGGALDDTLYGGRDNDVVKGGRGEDYIDGGTGADLIEGNSGDDTILGGTGEDNINAGSGADDVSAGSNADYVAGGAGDDTLRGESGHDTLSGGAGNDIMSGSTGFDILNGGSGNDRMFGGAQADTVEGTWGDDYIDGGSGNDLLRGGSHDDTLIGGTGQDTLSGGNGADVFVFSATSHSPHDATRDIITDFVSGEDMIDLSGFAGTLTFIGAAAYSGAAGEVRYNEGNGRLYINVDGAPGSDFSVDLTGAPSLIESDLIL